MNIICSKSIECDLPPLHFSCVTSTSHSWHLDTQVIVLTNRFGSKDLTSAYVTQQGTALALPTPRPWQSIAQTSIPSVQVDCRSYIDDEHTAMSSHGSRLSQYYGGVHAPNETPASRHSLRSLVGLHDSLPIPGSACSLC